MQDANSNLKKEKEKKKKLPKPNQTYQAEKLSMALLKVREQ